MSRRRSTRFAATAFGLVVAVAAGSCAEHVRSMWVTARVPDPIELPITAGGEGVRIAGALGGRTGAFLTVGDAASLVDLRLTDLPGQLYRISTPRGSGLAPRVSGTPGRVGLRFRSGRGTGPDAVTILLNRRVRWDIRLPAGAGEQHLDLRRGRVTRLDLGSAGLVRVRLPRPAGLVPITLRDAVGSVTLTTPPRTALRIRLAAGAGSLATPGRRAAPAARTTVLTSRGWRKAPAGYAIEARHRIESLTVASAP